uniref:Uncharacterized protein n=1 Tax=Pelusios castaneus TaxID=367368 RepID=A0A8C8SEE7_9SAUR
SPRRVFRTLHKQLSEGSMFGHGLKHLFHSRRRSREREHQNSQDSMSQHYGMSDHDSPDEKERSPEMHRVSYAMSLHDLPARPTAFNRVLQQIRSRPSIKRGTSLHSGSRRTKSSSIDPQKGSPHLVRKGPQDSSLTAILHQHQGRPRSSSATDTAILFAESGAVYLLSEESDCLADKVRLYGGATERWHWLAGQPWSYLVGCLVTGHHSALSYCRAQPSEDSMGVTEIGFGSVSPALCLQAESESENSESEARRDHFDHCLVSCITQAGECPQNNS